MTTQDTARRAADSDALEHLARIGPIAYGVVHLLVAWLAIQLAWFGGGGESADQSGAMSTLAESPVGEPLLWVLGLGLVALAVWQAAEMLRWRGGWSASGKARTGVFAWTGGQFLVGAAGLVLVGAGIWHIRKGVKKHFLEQIDTTGCSTGAVRLVPRLGQIGFPGKGIALAGVGVLLIWAAVTFDPAKASGLDGALHAILDLPFGQILLTLVAAGIAAFGAFCFVRAHYPERT